MGIQRQRVCSLMAWAAVAVDRNHVERIRVEEGLQASEEQLNRLLYWMVFNQLPTLHESRKSAMQGSL